MTDESTSARRLLSVLRERPHSVDSIRAEERRERALPLLRQYALAVAERRRRSAQRRRAAAGLAAAALVVLAAGFAVRAPRAVSRTEMIRAVSGHLVHRVGEASLPVSAGDALALPIGGELRTDVASPATLETTAGLRMVLAASSRLALAGLSPEATEQAVELPQGQLDCSVPKLGGNRHFSVVTPNARVVVHGTRFSVRVDSAEMGVTRTCVRVTEGVVSIHHAAGESTLRAGDQWGCRTEPPAQPPAAEIASKAPARPSSRNRGGRAEHVSGALREQTALLQAALAAERKGQLAAAALAADRLLSHYPDSPLAPEARALYERAVHAVPASP